MGAPIPKGITSEFHMRVPLLLLLSHAALLTACEPGAQAANVEEVPLQLEYTADGVVGVFDVAAIEDEMTWLRSEVWTDLRLFAFYWAPQLQEDGSTEWIDNGGVSAHAPISQPLPEEWLVGTVPEGWEEGWVQYNGHGGGLAWPDGALTTGYMVTVGMEAIDPLDPGNTRVTLTRANVKIVP